MGSSPLVGPRFRLLGPLEVLASDGSPVALGGRRSRELLAVLLLHANQSLSADRLVDLLWGEGASDGALTTVRTYVGQARRSLTEAGFDGSLVNRDGGYVLQLDRDEVDANAFEDALLRGQEELGLGDVERARATLTGALELWRGDVLADLRNPGFAEGVTVRLQELRTDAWEALMECELALGRHRDAVPRLQSLVAAHPFRERLTALLVVALYRSGRQADALAAYGATKRLLADELGIDPGPELTTLEAAVLRHDPGLAASPGAAPEAAGGTGTQPLPAAPAPMPDAVLATLSRRPIVGRDDALGRLRTGWQTAAGGGASMVLVSGPAGIGKSRLAAELAREAADGHAVVLVGRCQDSGAPYHPLVAALQADPSLASVCGDPPEPLPGWSVTAGIEPDDGPPRDPPGAERRLAMWRWFGGLLATAATSAPVLLVLDDAERLDVSSAQLLQHLALHPPARVMLLVCFRDPPGSRHAALRALLGDSPAATVVERVWLDPLTEDDVGALVAALGGVEPTPSFVHQLYERTGGNAFFATELARAASSAPPGDAALPVTLPASIRDVLRHRLHQLPTDTREVLSAAAVLGREAELYRLVALTERSDEAVVDAAAPAVASGFLITAGQSWAGGVAFPHDLLREAVYDEIAPPARERLHAKAAGVLLAGSARSDSDVVAAAGHLRRAGPAADPQESAALCLRAARVAARSLAWEEAVDHADAAIALLERTTSEAELRQARVEAAQLRLLAGFDQGGAVSLLEEVLGSALSAGDLPGAGALHGWLGAALCIHHSVMDIPRALDHLAAAERLVESPDRLVHVHRFRSTAAVFGVRTELIADASRQAHELATALARPDFDVHSRWAMAWHAINLGRVAEAVDVLDRAWEIARDLGDPYLGWPPVNGGALFATHFLLDPAAGRAWCRRGMGQPRFDAFRQPHATIVDQLALALLQMGETDAAREALTQLEPDASSLRVLRFRGGDWEGAAAEWAAALARDEAAGNLLDAVMNTRWLAEAHLALGEIEQATATLQRGLEIATDGPQVPSALWIHAELARLSAASDPGRARDHLARCDALLGGGEDWRGLRGQVEAARSVVLAACDDWPAATTAHQEAVAVLTAYRLPWHRAATLAAWASALARGGRDREAAQAIAAATAGYDRLGADDRWLRQHDLNTRLGLSGSPTQEPGKASR